MKRIFLLTFIFIFSCIGSAFAAVNPDYGPFNYGDTNIMFRGDLSPSGLGKIDTRNSTALWHNVRFKNVSTGFIFPTESYIPTVAFDIKENPGEDFGDAVGYHVIPLDYETISRYVQLANGNIDYVWPQLQKSTRIYYVLGAPYVTFAEMVQLCGGGKPEMISYKGINDGISGPTFDTTFLTTPWPYIDRFAGKQDGVLDPSEVHSDGQLYFNANAHSVYDTQITGWVTVNDDPSTKTQFFTQNTGVSNYTINYDNALPISTISSYLKEGSNKLTLTIQDGVGRQTTHSITINYVPAPIVPPVPPAPPAPQQPAPSGPKQVGVTGPVLQMKFGDMPSTVKMFSQMNVPVIITNNGDKPMTTNLSFSLKGTWGQSYIVCDDSGCYTKWRNVPMTETKDSGPLTIPAFGKVVWTISGGVTRDIGGPEPEVQSNMSLTSGGEKTEDGVPIGTSHYSPFLKVVAQDASDYVSPEIDMYIGTNYPLSPKPKVILAPSDPSLLNLINGQH